jgi:hypothetical protein
MTETGDGQAMVHAHCLTDEDLVTVAFDAGAPDPAALRHTADCDRCARRLVRLLQAARGVRAAAAGSVAPTPCLSEDQLAVVAQGSRAEADAVSHLAACARCASALAALVPLLNDPGVRAELQQVREAGSSSRSRSVARAAFGATTLAAAVVAGVLLRPGAVPNEPPVSEGIPHRESATAPIIVPRLVAPVGAGDAPDTLRWTSVPFADRYRVLLFDREGMLAWEAQSSDTSLALPEPLRRKAGAYLWKVEARTDWNRWVASAWAELAIPAR